MGAPSEDPLTHLVARATELRQSGESSALKPERGCLGNHTRGLGLRTRTRTSPTRHLLSPTRPTLRARHHSPHQGEGGRLVVFFSEPGSITSFHPFFLH